MTTTDQSTQGPRFVPVEVTDQPGRWRVYDTLAVRPVRPHGWPGWEHPDEAAAREAAQTLNEGGPQVARVREIVTDTWGEPVDETIVRRIARVLCTLYSPAALAELPDSVVLDLLWVFQTDADPMPTLTDESQPAPLVLNEGFHALLRRGIEWLSTEQRTDAMADHSGIRASERHASWSARLRPAVIPRTSHAAERLPAVVFTALGGPLSTEEVDELRTAVDGVAPVVDEWNGAGAESVSFAIAREPHVTLIEALDRRQAGCDQHAPTVQCGRVSFGLLQLVTPEGWR